eukprot:8908271-Prorocentrum_lima.AAC.1
MEKLAARRADLAKELEEAKLQEAALEREAVTQLPPPSALSSDTLKEVLTKAVGALQAATAAGGNEEKRRKVATETPDAKMEENGGTAAATASSTTSPTELQQTTLQLQQLLT